MLCLVTQSCLTLWDPMDCNLPGSSVHGKSLGKNTGVGCHSLLQGIFPTQGLNLGLLHCRWILHHLSHQGSPRILEWVAYPFSRGSSQPRNQTRVSCIAGRFFTISAIFWPRGLQHTRPLCPSSSLTACSNSCPLSWWCHPTISSPIAPFSSCLQSFPASGSFLMSQLFTSGGQSIGVSASASVLPMNIQGWFPLGWTSLITLQSKGLSWVFSNTTVQKHQFFSTQLSL